MSRRQRRAQANNNSTGTGTTKLTSASDIPLSHPNPNDPKPAKTLFEIAEERRSKLQPDSQPFNFSSQSDNVVNVKIKEDGTVERFSPSDNDQPLPPLWDTLFFSTSLSALHFTLATLTMHQYAQELEFRPLIMQTVFQAFPTLTLIVHLFRGHLLPEVVVRAYDSASETTQVLLYGARQLSLLVLANVAGAYLIYVCNDRGYYAVMKDAPSIGTLWVWSILELGLLGAVLGVLGPASWARLKGYTIF